MSLVDDCCVLDVIELLINAGADVEVVSMLVDRMRSDAAVSRAARLSLALTLDENDELNEEEENDDDEDRKGNNNKNGRRMRLPSDEVLLPPTRLFDRRQRLFSVQPF